jgi:hypothetical protein
MREPGRCLRRVRLVARTRRGVIATTRCAGSPVPWPAVVGVHGAYRDSLGRRPLVVPTVGPLNQGYVATTGGSHEMSTGKGEVVP